MTSYQLTMITDEFEDNPRVKFDIQLRAFSTIRRMNSLHIK